MEAQPVAPTVPSMPIMPPVEPVSPVMEAQPVAPTVPSMPVMPPVEPVPPIMEAQPVAPTVPSIPVMNFESNMSIPEMAPIIESNIPPVESNNEINTLDVTVPNASEQPVNLTINEPVIPQPIIVTDYTKQYDPVMPNSVSVPQTKVDFKEIVTVLRECSAKIEKYGYKIDVEEYDLSTLYQVVFKIEK